MRFYESALNHNFKQANVKALISAAKGATTSETRRLLCQAVADSEEGLDSEDLKGQCKLVSNMMTSNLPLSQQVAYILQKDSVARLSMVTSFAALTDAAEPAFDFNTLTPFVTIPDDFPDVEFEKFTKAINVINEAGNTKKSVANPMTTPILDLFKAMGKFNLHDKEWATPLAKAAAQSRLGVQSWNAATFDVTKVEAEHIVQLNEAMMNVISGKVGTGQQGAWEDAWVTANQAAICALAPAPSTAAVAPAAPGVAAASSDAAAGLAAAAAAAGAVPAAALPKAREWKEGDKVRLRVTKDKAKFNGHEAVVEAVFKNNLKVV